MLSFSLSFLLILSLLSLIVPSLFSHFSFPLSSPSTHPFDYLSCPSLIPSLLVLTPLLILYLLYLLMPSPFPSHFFHSLSLPHVHTNSCLCRFHCYYLCVCVFICRYQNTLPGRNICYFELIQKL